MAAGSIPPPPPPPKTRPATEATDAVPAKTRKFRRASGDSFNFCVTINCQSGWGKTTLMAHSPNPLVICSPHETGFQTLVKAGRVPDVHYEIVSSTNEFLSLLDDPAIHQFDTICIDTISGIYAMIASEVLESKFQGNSLKYNMHAKGDRASAMVWATIIPRLERLKKHCSIIAATHATTSNVNNPDGENFSRHTARIHKESWPLLQEFSDAVLFGTFFTTVDDETGKAKGGTKRVVRTQNAASWDAKNRFGMPELIQVPDDPSKVYETIFSHINKEGK